MNNAAVMYGNEALGEAVTFGGFRVGDRTNVAAVKRAPAAAVVEIRDGTIALRRYRRWPVEFSPSTPEGKRCSMHGRSRRARTIPSPTPR